MGRRKFINKIAQASVYTVAAPLIEGAVSFVDAEQDNSLGGLMKKHNLSERTKSHLHNYLAGLKLPVSSRALLIHLVMHKNIGMQRKQAEEFADKTLEISEGTGVPVTFLLSVALKESGLKPKAVSPLGEFKGAGQFSDRTGINHLKIAQEGGLLPEKDKNGKPVKYTPFNIGQQLGVMAVYFWQFRGEDNKLSIFEILKARFRYRGRSLPSRGNILRDTDVAEVWNMHLFLQDILEAKDSQKKPVTANAAGAGRLGGHIEKNFDRKTTVLGRAISLPFKQQKPRQITQNSLKLQVFKIIAENIATHEKKEAIENLETKEEAMDFLLGLIESSSYISGVIDGRDAKEILKDAVYFIDRADIRVFTNNGRARAIQAKGKYFLGNGDPDRNSIALIEGFFWEDKNSNSLLNKPVLRAETILHEALEAVTAKDEEIHHELRDGIQRQIFGPDNPLGRAIARYIENNLPGRLSRSLLQMDYDLSVSQVNRCLDEIWALLETEMAIDNSNYVLHRPRFDELEELSEEKSYIIPELENLAGEINNVLKGKISNIVLDEPAEPDVFSKTWLERDLNDWIKCADFYNKMASEYANDREFLMGVIGVSEEDLQDRSSQRAFVKFKAGWYANGSDNKPFGASREQAEEILKFLNSVWTAFDLKNGNGNASAAGDSGIGAKANAAAKQILIITADKAIAMRRISEIIPASAMGGVNIVYEEIIDGSLNELSSLAAKASRFDEIVIYFPDNSALAASVGANLAGVIFTDLSDNAQEASFIRELEEGL